MSFDQLHFKLTWRTYQDTVLNNFEEHIEDNHFHIVAPPGSGKTILGIEIIKRLRKKTLVLAPTLTIRDQWENRLQTFFTEKQDFKKISFNIKDPSDITFTTYQALHNFYKTFENEYDYYDFFKSHSIEVLLLDEAHHLKNAWWKCLYDLKEQHSQTIVALTATPPYDSESSEIIKYFKLCGEIDDEIVIPDLVKEKNLAPHQDLIYFSKPESDESVYLTNFKQKVKEFIQSLFHTPEFVKIIKNHRFFLNTENHLEEIYKYPDLFSSILIFLNSLDIEIPLEKLNLLGFDEKEKIEFPETSYEWLEILLQGVLVIDRENLQDNEDYILSLEKELKKLSVFENNKVQLNGNEGIHKSLRNSPSKLKSVLNIVRQEQKNLREELRCVVLTDYIRKEFLNIPKTEVHLIDKIGVIPIFLRLKDVIFYPKSLAVLSGSIVIIHQTLIEQIEKIDEIDNYRFDYLQSDTNFVLVNSKASSSKKIVEVMTKLFELGHIKVLIGTKSLLGEGWDAPSINSLILASFVGSYVTSNQMRGRAIRINPQNPNKVGLIWHLACVDPSDETGGKDLDLLKRRFHSFLGIRNDSLHNIENGISRLNLPKKFFGNDIDRLNENTFLTSEKRTEISNTWRKSIFNGKKIYDEISVNLPKKKPTQFTKLNYQNALFYSFKQTTFIAILMSICIAIFFIIEDKISRNILYLIISSFLVWFSLSFYRNMRSYLVYNLQDKRIHKIAKAVLVTLIDLELLSTHKNKLKLKTKLKGKGAIGITIFGANRLESKTFINTLNEVLQPIDNPRYLIRERKKSWFFYKIKHSSYSTVPDLFAINKTTATTFLNNWNEKVGYATIVYTRTPNGRKQLLRARLQTIRKRNEQLIKKKVIWR
jgi:superfamily II DNA or RNA helicase